MNLTSLRRLVLVGNVGALAAAGGAAWHAFDSRPAPRDEKEWPKLFPVKAAAPAEAAGQQLPPLPEFTAAATWPQGDKPVAVKATTEEVKPKVPEFQTRYRLNVVFVGESRAESYAQLTTQGGGQPGPGFSVRLGEKIPEDPADLRNPVRTPWRLDEVSAAAGAGGRATALFRNVDTDEEQILELQTGGSGGGLSVPGGPPGGAQFGKVSRPDGKTERDQPSRVIFVGDRAKGEYAFEIPEEEIDWLGDWGDEEAGKIATVAARDAAGNPDGFTLKSVPAGSRAADMGFKPEDRVIAVNSEKVHSTEQAVSVGKRQYDGGTSVFIVKVLRAGKELNYTFHAKRKTRK